MGKIPPPPLLPTEPPKKDADHKHKIKLPEPIIPAQSAKPAAVKATVGATPPPGQPKPTDVDHKHKVKLPPTPVGPPVGQPAPAAGSTAAIAPKPAAGSKPGVGSKPGPAGGLPTVGAKLATGAKPGAHHPPGGPKPPPGHPLAGKPQKVPPKFPHSAKVLSGFRKLFNNYSSEGRGNVS